MYYTINPDHPSYNGFIAYIASCDKCQDAVLSLLYRLPEQFGFCPVDEDTAYLQPTSYEQGGIIAVAPTPEQRAARIPDPSIWAHEDHPDDGTRYYYPRVRRIQHFVRYKFALDHLYDPDWRWELNKNQDFDPGNTLPKDIRDRLNKYKTARRIGLDKLPKPHLYNKESKSIDTYLTIQKDFSDSEVISKESFPKSIKPNTLFAYGYHYIDVETPPMIEGVVANHDLPVAISLLDRFQSLPYIAIGQLAKTLGMKEPSTPEENKNPHFSYVLDDRDPDNLRWIFRTNMQFEHPLTPVTLTTEEIATLFPEE